MKRFHTKKSEKISLSQQKAFGSKQGKDKKIGSKQGKNTKNTERAEKTAKRKPINKILDYAIVKKEWHAHLYGIFCEIIDNLEILYKNLVILARSQNNNRIKGSAYLHNSCKSKLL